MFKFNQNFKNDISKQFHIDQSITMDGSNSMIKRIDTKVVSMRRGLMATLINQMMIEDPLLVLKAKKMVQYKRNLIQKSEYPIRKVEINGGCHNTDFNNYKIQIKNMSTSQSLLTKYHQPSQHLTLEFYIPIVLILKLLTKKENKNSHNKKNLKLQKHNLNSQKFQKGIDCQYF